MHTLGFFLRLEKGHIMKAKTIFFAFTLFLTTLLFPQISRADDTASVSSASLGSLLVAKQAADNRVAMLRAYLEAQDSPLAPYANTFVSQADVNQLDWRFVAAIAGRESTFGKEEPCINPFGYGIYGSITTCFNSYDDAIKTVSKALREQYMNQWGAQTVWDVGSMYAASPTWASGVVYFMNDMQKFALNQGTPLPISL